MPAADQKSATQYGLNETTDASWKGCNQHAAKHNNPTAVPPQSAYKNREHAKLKLLRA